MRWKVCNMFVSRSKNHKYALSCFRDKMQCSHKARWGIIQVAAHIAASKGAYFLSEMGVTVNSMWPSNIAAEWADGSQRAEVTKPVVQHVVIHMSVKVDSPGDDVWNAKAVWVPLPRQQAMPAEERCVSERWGEVERERGSEREKMRSLSQKLWHS